MKRYITLALLLIGIVGWSQTTVFSENMGTPSSTSPIASYILGTAPSTFQNISTLTYSNGTQTNSADVRTSNSSNSYSGASGSGNVFFTSTNNAYGFSIESINASNYTSLTLNYGYSKESASSHATFSVEYWDGSAWQTIANSSAALFNESTGASAGWYAAKTLSLPTGAQISGLKIRFVKTGTTAIRIDDVVLKGTVGISSVQSGDWNTASTWSCNCVPASSSNVIIATSHIVSTSISLSRTSTTTINGTFQINQGGFATGGTWIYGSSGALIFNHTQSTSYGPIDSGHSYWPSTNGPFNVTVNNAGSGGINMGVSRTVEGTFATAAAVVNPGNLTINGTLLLNSGYSFSGSGNPVYGNASLLKYNSGGSPGRNAEWTASSGTIGITGGFPNNVQLSNNTTLNFPNTNNFTRAINGSLTIDSGSSLPINYSGGSSGLVVGKDVIINGSLILGTVAGGDLTIGGNWTRGATGTFNPYGRAVIFNGTGTQVVTVTGGGTETFNFLVVQGSGTLQLSSAGSGTNILVNTVDGLSLSSSNAVSTIDLNGRTLTLSSGGNLNLNGGNRKITSAVANGRLTFSGGLDITTTVTNGGTLTSDSNTTVDLQSGLNCGGSSLFTINGTLQLNANGFCVGNSPKYGAASLLQYNSGTNPYKRQLEWTAAIGAVGTPGLPQNVQISNNTILNYVNPLNLGDKGILGDLTIDSGSKLFMDYGNTTCGGALTVSGNLTVTGSLTLGFSNADDLKIGGNITFNAGYFFDAKKRAIFFTKNGTQTIAGTGGMPTFHYVLQTPSSGSNTIQLLGMDLNITAPNGGNAIDLGTQSANNFDINGRTLTIGTVGVGNVVSGSGKFKGSTTSNLTLLGLGSIDKLNFTTGYRNLGTLTINREAATTAATLGTDVTINTALVLTNGNLVLNASDLIISSTATSTNNGASSFVIAQGNGQFKKFIDANGSFTFPIGETTSGLDYSPATLAYTASSYSNAFIAVNVSDAKHPNNVATTDFITRYWSVSSSGITSPTYSFSGTYTTADIVGTESNAKPGRYNGAIWTDLSASPISSNTLTLTGLTTFSSTNDFSAGSPLSFQEINVQQAGIDFATLSTYAFGNKEVGSSTDVEFTIQNLGAANLTIFSTTITGTGFSLITSPNSPVTGSTTFTIRFLPNAIGTFSGKVTITNNDADEGMYEINFTGTGIPSANSDIIANGAYTYDSNIDYTLYQAAIITNTSHSVNLFKFDIRDGGSAANDLDNLPTILNAITFNITNTSMIRSAALFNGNAMVNNAPTINVATGTIAFIGLSGNDVTALDNASQSLTLRATFTNTVTDNTQFQVTINNANATVPSDNTSSGFNAFTAVVSSTINDRNRLEVTADRLAFGQQPSNTTVNVAMTPSVTVNAVDANGNIDADYTNTIGITSTGALSGNTVNFIASNGVATYSSLTHTATGTGLTLRATTTGLAISNFVDSAAFSITAVLFSNGDYKTKTGGIWLGGSPTATWQRYNSSTSTWSDSSAPSSSTSNNIYIEDGHSITTGGPFANGVNIKVKSGGTFTSNFSSTANSIYIFNGGKFVYSSNQLVINSAFEIEDGGTFEFKYSSNPGSSLTNSLWKGTENFHPNSNFVIKDHKTATGNYFLPSEADITPQNYNGVTAYFGNIIIDLELANDTGTFRFNNGNFNGKKLTHNDFILRSSNSTITLLSTAADLTIGHDLILESSLTNNINITSSGITSTLNIKGSLINNSPKILTLSNNSSSNITANVDGDLILSNTGAITLIGTSASGATATINLKGDLTVDSGAILNSTFSGATFNFTGTGDGLTAATTQTIDIASTGATRNKNIDFKDTNGAYVQLINNNLELGTNSTFLVYSGGKLDFQTYSITPIDATPTFTSNSGSTLITSNSNGFGGTTAGALQNFSSVGTSSSAGRAVLKAGTNYIINGATSTPFPVPTSNFGNPSSVTINADTTSNMTANLTVSSAFTVNNGGVFRLNNTGLNLSSAALTVASGGVFDNSGENQVESVAGSSSVAVNGTFITKATAGFNGTTATAINSNNNPTINLATGSTVEYAGASQMLTPISVPNPYYNLKISGSGTKMLPSTEVLVNNNLDITASKLQIDAQKLLTVVNAINTIDGGIEIKNEGNLVQVHDGVADTGIIKMERISRAMKINDYVYWGSPVQGNVLGQMPAGFDISYIWDLDGSTDGTWNPTVATVPGRGFITRASEIGAKTFNFSNVPNNGVVTYQTNSHCDCATPNADELTYTGNTALVGNPYPSAIDAKKFLEDSANGGLGGTLFFWSSSTEYTGTVYNVDDYASWNLTGGTATSAAPASNNILSLKPSGKIAAGQGFFVQTFNDANVTFNNQMRLRTTTDNGQFYRMNNSNVEENNPISHRIWLNLTNENGDFRQALVGYVPNATNAFDKLYDGDSFTSNAIDLYSIVDSRQLVIQGRALPFQDTDLVPMGIKVANAGNYTITIDELDGLFTGNQNVYLEDLNLNIIHDLKSAPYVFASESGTFNNRFVLRFTNTTLTSTDFGANNSVMVYKDKNAFKINSSVANIDNVTVFDVLGRKILDANNIHNKNFSKENLIVNQQTLIVKIKLSDGTMLTKKIVF